jgi:hypothetical protein
MEKVHRIRRLEAAPCRRGVAAPGQEQKQQAEDQQD